ncbi:multidrug effflux MFS transporter [Rhizobiaceae bacterium BDR2-2]|uniref:Bcr/CflA family efflux transporter n=1 Tax=Ectorhizobium quercum TaxID=2965071 RepID=A0AAE3N409_9HYPH|nr:multidrug effflux MFS transporter [Ectorhizobium quercum]MCX8999582.1 multidrug effflux MFS transporter [Ectorhizobium quercum]
MTVQKMTERRTALLGALLTAIGPLSMAIYAPAMPELVRAFSTTDAAITASLSFYFGGFAVAQLAAGAASDAFGRRPACLTFFAIYLAGAVMACLAPTVEWLLAGRLIQGVGASVGVTVARAVVRDQFSGIQAARIMNLIGIILGVGPALGPIIGGITLELFGWQAVFLLMIALGLACCAAVVSMPETTVPDISRFRPGTMLATYGRLGIDPRFVLPSLVVGGAVGALYTQATMLPFILIKIVGLSPSQYGFVMLFQTGSYFIGSVVLRVLPPRFGGHRSVVAGLLFCGTGAAMMLFLSRLVEPTLLTVMIPISFTTFGIALITPHIVTVALTPFPKVAGSASAMMGFIQMGAGFCMGLAGALFSSPVIAYGTLLPAMHATAILSYIAYLRLFPSGRE